MKRTNRCKCRNLGTKYAVAKALNVEVVYYNSDKHTLSVTVHNYGDVRVDVNMKEIKSKDEFHEAIDEAAREYRRWELM